MKFAASIFAGCAVQWAIDRPFLIEALAYGFTVAAMFCALTFVEKTVRR